MYGPIAVSDKVRFSSGLGTEQEIRIAEISAREATDINLFCMF